MRGGVINCVAKVSDRGLREEFENTNVRRVENLITAAARLASRSPHIVQLSSADVYGSPNRCVSEDHPLSPIGIPYVDTKIGSEAALAEARKTGLPVTILRPTNVIGPGSKTYIEELLNAARSLRFVPDVAAPQSYGSLLCIENLVKAIAGSRATPRPSARPTPSAPRCRCVGHSNIADLTCAAGLSLPIVRLPFRLVYMMASSAERVASFYKWTTRPPLTRLALQIIGTEQNFTSAKLRALAGYRGGRDL